jgi:hypothetical protein
MSFTKILGSGISTNSNLYVGVLTATKFIGDGSQLTGIDANVTSGVGIQSGGSSVGSGISFLNFIGVGNTFALRGDVLDISISSGSEGIVGINTAGISTFNNLEISGIIATGLVTATSFDGDLTGNADTATSSTYAEVAGVSTYSSTAGIATTAQGLTGTPNIVVGVITATKTNTGDLDVTGSLSVTGGANFNNPTGIITTGTLDVTTLSIGNLSIGNLNSSGIVTATSLDISGNVSVGGTLTYEDVTNIDSVGIITARSDVSIADKIVHTSDTDTAIRFPANDTVTVETGGSERVRVRSTGDVGIGTVLPGNALHVFKNGDGQTPVFFETSNTTGKLRFYNDSNGWSLDSEGELRFVAGRTASGTPVSLHITPAGAAIFKRGLAEKYENAGTTLGAQEDNPLSDGNVILFTGNESGNTSINFTGVNSTLSNGETVSFTAIITPNGSGVINVVQVDGQAITVKWAGGSAPTAGASGQDVYTFQILRIGTGTGSSDYTVFGAATNYA